MEQVDWQSLPKKERRRLKRELEKEEEQKKKASRRLGYWVIGLLVIGLLIVGSWWLVKELTKPMPGQAVSDQGRNHVSREEWEKFSYNSNPPTSGPHDPVWTKTGVYSEPQGDGHLVHALEHGYIIISYNCDKTADCEGLKNKLSDLVNEKRIWKLIVVPRSNLDSLIALTAWGRIDKMDVFDKKRTEAFIDGFRNKGPEKTME